MSNSVSDKVRNWNQDLEISEEQGIDFVSLYDQIMFLANEKYDGYHPTSGALPNFNLRLKHWLNNLTNEDDQRILLRLIPHLFYVDEKDFLALHQSAFQGPISRWLMDQTGMTYEDAVFTDGIKKATSETWFCRMTDSMDIAAFLHVNNIGGQEIRPDWYSMALLDQKTGIHEFLLTNWMNDPLKTLKRIVLLEDFVGSGDQMRTVLNFVSSLASKPEILITPLLVGSGGYSVGLDYANNYSNISFSPLLQISDDAFVHEQRVQDEPELFAAVRALAQRVHSIVRNETNPNLLEKPYGPFGFGAPPCKGGLVIMHTNCPDNSMPMIHHMSASWKPLFPRSSRL